MIDETFIDDLRKHLKESKDYVELVDKLVIPHIGSLDSLITEISRETKKPDYSLDIEVLQEYYLKISSELYLAIDKLKQFEIYSSLAKATEIEVYNKTYLSESISVTENGKKPAVEELKIRASSKSKKEALINTVYSSAYKAIKSKIDAGTMVADTLKNIIKAKTSLEFSISQTNTNTNRGV